MIEAVTRYGSKSDPRPFATIKLENIEMSGLLDLGASVSILGRECREVVDQLGLEIKKFFSNIKIASGRKHRLLGRFEAVVEYKDIKKKIWFYLCPDLDQKVYLGIDFWTAFELAPNI